MLIGQGITLVAKITLIKLPIVFNYEESVKIIEISDSSL
jgi:hypothetical protein